MALIPKEDMTTLQTASSVRTVAATAVSIMEEMSVAALINNAANTGEYFAIWEHPMSDELKEKLEGKGYTVTPQRHAADPRVLWEISWKS